jgi:hypothetical protein
MDPVVCAGSHDANTIIRAPASDARPSRPVMILTSSICS